MLLLPEQHDCAEVCTCLLGHSACKCSPMEVFCRLISFYVINIFVLHTHAGRSEALGSRCKCQLCSASRFCFPLLSLLWGNELPKQAHYQLACVTHANRWNKQILLCLHPKTLDWSNFPHECYKSSSLMVHKLGDESSSFTFTLICSQSLKVYINTLITNKCISNLKAQWWTASVFALQVVALAQYEFDTFSFLYANQCKMNSCKRLICCPLCGRIVFSTNNAMLKASECRRNLKQRGHKYFLEACVT